MYLARAIVFRIFRKAAVNFRIITCFYIAFCAHSQIDGEIKLQPQKDEQEKISEQTKRFEKNELNRRRDELRSAIAGIDKMKLTSEMLGYLPNLGVYPGRTGEEWLKVIKEMKTSYMAENYWGIENDFTLIDEIKMKVSRYYDVKYLLKIRKIPQINYDEIKTGYDRIMQNGGSISTDTLPGEIYFLYAAFICSARESPDYPEFLKIVKNERIMNLQAENCDVNSNDSDFAGYRTLLHEISKFNKNEEQTLLLFFSKLTDAASNGLILAVNIVEDFGKKQKHDSIDSIFYNKATSFLKSTEAVHYIQIYKKYTPVNEYQISGIARAEKIVLRLKGKGY